MNARDQKTNVRDFNRTAGNAVMTTKEEEFTPEKMETEMEKAQNHNKCIS